MVYFSLRAKNVKEKNKTNKIIKDLKKEFGEENFTITDFEFWISLEIENVNGWIEINDVSYGNKSRLHLYSRLENTNYDIPLEHCDTIYML